MPEIDPITREEKLWNGEDIEPITREEMYIKHIYDKTQTIPSKPITRKEVLLEKAGQGGGGDVTIKQLSVTANGTYSEENTAYSPVIVNVPAPPIPDNAYLLNEVEGLPKDIATFDNGASLPMPSLKVGIEPQQDLHGYDHPWVGGAGKNKLNYDAWKGLSVINGTAIYENNGVTLTSTKNDCYTAFGGWSNDKKIPVFEGETIILSWEESTNQIGEVYIFPNGNVQGLVVVNNNVSKQVTYTVGSDVTFITFRFGVTNAGATISYKNIMVRKSGDATFAPYSNICPISGHTEANVTRWGKNLIASITEGMDLTSATGDAKVTAGWYLINYTRIEVGKTYFLSGTSSATICYYDKYKTFTRTTRDIRSIIPRKGECYVRCNSLIDGYSEPQIEEGNEATSFSPIGQTYNIQFKDGTTPLTVYGGTLDVVSGELTVDRLYFEISDFDAWEYQEYNNFKALYKNLSNLGYPPIKQSEDKKVISDKFEYKLGGTGHPFGVVSIYQNGIVYFWNNDNVYANKNEMIAAMNSIKPAIVYELATPQIYQLTPTQVKSLLGTNNVWADTGDIEELEYFSKEA